MKKVFSVFLALAVMGASSLWAQQVIFKDGFETGTLNSEFWTANPAAANGIVQPVQQVSGVMNLPHSGSWALAMGRTNDTGPLATNILDLHLDLSGYKDVTLEFWIRDEEDENHDEDAILISDDGGQSFVRALRLHPAIWANSIYGLVVVDLGMAATFNNKELSDQFVVRFQQRGLYDFDPAPRRDGFFIDDVVVRGAPQYATLPFTDGFEADTLGPAWRRADPFNSDMPVVESESQWGFIEPVRRFDNLPDIPRTGNYALGIGRPGFAFGNGVNALDLHLDLSGHKDVTLEFWIRDEEDENHDEDVILISDDGGQNFVRALRLYPAIWGNSVYGLVVVDLGIAAALNDMELNDQFVVRFQQRGAYDFDPTTRRDGFFIDDLVVQGRPQYATLPFTDGFEADMLGPAWRRADRFNSDMPVVESESQWGFISPVRRLSDLPDIPRTGDYALGIGRPDAAGGNGVNALDLHLDLSGQNQVELRFFLRDEDDGNDNEDAVLISDDGGKTFESVFAINPASRPNGVYSEIVLRIDSLAQVRNLSLSNEFVIRFQQRGQYGFSPGSRRDGFFIDDVLVDVKTAVADQERSVPTNFTLNQNYPNPFNPSTKISFALPSAQEVTLKVFDLTGKEVAALLDNERKPAGVHEMIFNAHQLPSGVYLYRLEAGKSVEMKKMLLVR